MLRGVLVVTLGLAAGCRATPPAASPPRADAGRPRGEPLTPLQRLGERAAVVGLATSIDGGWQLTLARDGSPLAVVRDAPRACADRLPATSWLVFTGDPPLALALTEPPRAYVWAKQDWCAVPLALESPGEPQTSPPMAVSVALGGDEDPPAQVVERPLPGLGPAATRLRLAIDRDHASVSVLDDRGEVLTLRELQPCTVHRLEVEARVVAGALALRLVEECSEGESEHHGRVEKSTTQLRWTPGARAPQELARDEAIEETAWDSLSERKREWTSRLRTHELGPGALRSEELHARQRDAWSSCDDADERCCETIRDVEGSTRRWYAGRDEGPPVREEATARAHYEFDGCEARVNKAVAAGTIREHEGVFVAVARPQLASSDRLAGRRACDEIDVDGLGPFRAADREELAALVRAGLAPPGVYRVGAGLQPFTPPEAAPPDSNLKQNAAVVVVVDASGARRVEPPLTVEVVCITP